MWVAQITSDCKTAATHAFVFGLESDPGNYLRGVMFLSVSTPELQLDVSLRSTIHKHNRPD